MEKILRSLTPRFEHVAVVTEEANEISTMTVWLLSGSLPAHEQWMNDNKIEKPIEQTLQAQASIGIASIINTVVHEVKDKDVVIDISAKVVVARIMEALSKTTLVPITIQVQITLARRTRRHV